MGSIVKVIEIIAQSPNSFEEAVQDAVSEASRTIDDIRSVWIKDFKVEVRDNKITAWRVNAHVSFELKGR
jgi:flavin-binding protein dodecin